MERIKIWGVMVAVDGCRKYSGRNGSGGGARDGRARTTTDCERTKGRFTRTPPQAPKVHTMPQSQYTTHIRLTLARIYSPIPISLSSANAPMKFTTMPCTRGKNGRQKKVFQKLEAQLLPSLPIRPTQFRRSKDNIQSLILQNSLKYQEPHSLQMTQQKPDCRFFLKGKVITEE